MKGRVTKLAISNIAWLAAEEPLIADHMQAQQIAGVEVAPTMIWSNPVNVSADELHRYRQFWAQRGIQIVALQSLLYGRPDLTIFDNKAQRRETLKYLGDLMPLAAMLGARSLVFGSPKNRQVKNLPAATVEEIALEFFHAAAEIALLHDVILCIEPNPIQYECDFATNSAAALTLVNKVNHRGFGLHLDSAALHLSEENVADVLANCAGSVCHFHASEPYLAPLGQGGVEHKMIGRLLKGVGYPNWVSVEMRRNPAVDAVVEIQRVATFLRACYGD